MFIYVSYNARDSQVSSYTPFHFSFTVPLNNVLFLLCDFTNILFRKKNNFCEELENKFILAVELGIFKKIESQFIRKLF